jgi:predicted RNA binding protein YcfA (HicA-like mRNA interferase family)
MHTVKEVIQRLRRDGWQELPGKGSHRVFRKSGQPNISIPTSKKELSAGVYRDAAKKPDGNKPAAFEQIGRILYGKICI